MTVVKLKRRGAGHWLPECVARLTAEKRGKH
jgi:hypothetical protein